MKKIIILISLVVCFACAEGLVRADGTAVGNCNSPSDDSNKGVPGTSCNFVAKTITPGLNAAFAGESAFFFDADVYAPMIVDGKSKLIPLRFFSYENDKTYNTIQALVQTAYATRASMNVIFLNPFYTLLESDKHVSSESCYKNKDRAGNFVSINCRVQAIQLFNE